MADDRFRAAPALEPLKMFQRRTVDFVFERLYGANEPVRQFLVADEVGLGKTMVARGVIARMIEHLWDTVERIDVLYICSNQAIAAQNLENLNVLGRRALALPTRMTLIPLQTGAEDGLDANKVNFISLTPGTTFDLRSATGVVQERALLLHLLEGFVDPPRRLFNLLQVNVGVDRWKLVADEIGACDVNTRIRDRFRYDLENDPDLCAQLKRVSEMFWRRRSTYPEKMVQARNGLIARLRALLSRACVDALEPDLIILDEFQRFRDLLHGNSDAAELAHALFAYSSEKGDAARTLLLSATPYRMLTLTGDDPEEGDHYQDFLETVSFLYGRDEGSKVAATLAEEMGAFRRFLLGLPQSHASAVEARRTVEGRLRKVMARTERVGSTSERDSMVAEPPVPVSVKPADLAQADAVSKLARLLDAPEIIEYWKSAPYLLNFMRDYRLKRLLKQQGGAPPAALREAIHAARHTMLARAKIKAYKSLEPANGRMRAIMDDVFADGLEQNLWIPPALPYYGVPRANPPLTKALVFSSWSMVPDAIAALLSYEAERRMGAGGPGRGYFKKETGRRLQFQRDQGRLTGLRALLLIYPSPTLARVADPLAVFSERDEALSQPAMRDAVADLLEPALTALRLAADRLQTSAVAEWAAPAVIDGLFGTRAGEWLLASNGMGAAAGEDGFREHVSELGEAARLRDFAVVPDEIRDVLVDVALGSPAVCALRALHRIAPELDWDDPCLLAAATKVAWAFRTLFNQRESIALLGQSGDDIYWHRVLAFCAEHNLQAVLDEYTHYLVGRGDMAPQERVEKVAIAMAKALSIRPSQIEVDDVRIKGDAIAIEPFQMRGRFAMRLADYSDEDGAVARLAGVRDAFNSPFRPFVLATTSVGQEGLDFHPYCYRVYHWNLPGNPVDMEQREGRVHRFKGHAVRLNLAQRQSAALRGNGPVSGDPWQLMFERARWETSADTDLVPYWIYEGAVRVERRVPILPFSREVARLAWLKRSLAVYRLAFGQPRQDDLLDYLQTLDLSDWQVSDMEELHIRLQPGKAQTGSSPHGAGDGSGGL